MSDSNQTVIQSGQPLTIVNPQNLRAALVFFKSDDEIWEKIKADFPDQLADLVSWKENPNCQCGQRLYQFFNNLLGVHVTALDKYVVDVNKFNSEIVNQQKIEQQNLLAGQIIVIEKGEHAFQELFRSLEGKQFAMFSAVEREDTVAFYFL